MSRAEVGPLAEVGFSQKDRSGGSQPGGDGRIPGGDDAGKRQGTRGGLHAVGGVEVVLQKDGEAVERASRAPGLALAVEGIGNRERVGIDFDHRAGGRAGLVDGADAVEVELAKGP